MCGCQLAREPCVCTQAMTPTARVRSSVSARMAAETVRAATRARSPRSARRYRRYARSRSVPLLAALGEERQRSVSVELLAARFHESVASAAAAVAMRVADSVGLDTVALGGGSFQNARLLSGVRRRLEEPGLRVLVPRRLGPNDGAISYGQAAVAAAILAGEGESGLRRDQKGRRGG